MSDARELPERVWIDPGFFGSHGLWEYDRLDDDGEHVPYLRADKPDRYAVLIDGRCYHNELFPTKEAAEANAHGSDTIHPVYIGPAIEPEEESDTLS